MTMRELWWAACGAYDRDLRNRAFWQSAFGSPPTAAELTDSHPLRRLEQWRPPDKSPDVRAADSAAGWKAVNQYFTQKRG